MNTQRADSITRTTIQLLKEERLRAGMSHQALADAAGINRSTISLLEAEKRTPTLVVCLKIAQALNIDLADYLKKAQKKHLKNTSQS